MSNFIHGDNLEHKVRIERNVRNKRLLREIKAKYSEWKQENIVTESYEVSLDVDPKYSLIDQIYVLRKDDGKNPIYDDVIYDLFKFVESHINSDWYNIKSKIKRGKMI